MTTWRGFVATAMTAIVLLLSAQLNAGDVEYKPRVQIRIQAESQLKGRVTSYLSRELRNLPGVVVVDSDPDWIISGIAMHTQTEAGRQTGYVMSFVVLSPFSPSLFRAMKAAKIDEGAIRFAEKFTEGVEDFRHHVLLVGPDETIRQEIEEYVARFDAGHLEPVRKAMQQLVDELRETKEKGGAEPRLNSSPKSR